MRQNKLRANLQVTGLITFPAFNQNVSNTGQHQKITGFCLPPHIIGLILKKHLFGYKLYHCHAETTCKFPAIGKGKKINGVQRAAMRLSTILDRKNIFKGGIDRTA